MAQNLQHISAETHLTPNSIVKVDSESSGSPVDTLKVVTCPVCRAVYMPFSAQPDAECSSFPLLEAAFLRVCHFCFHCQRPACPQCWGQQHNLCASCSEAAHLPFQAPLSSFEGLIFSPPVFAQANQTSTLLSFTCLRNGRCSTSGPLYTQAAEDDERALSSRPVIPKASPAFSAPSPYPPWLQEVLGRRGTEPTGDAVQPAQALPGEAMNQEENVSAQPQTDESVWPVIEPDTLVPKQEATAETEAAPDENMAQPMKAPEKSGLFERIENILIFVASLTLVVIVLLLVLALSSVGMNAFFLRVIHIDIRAEIAYLLQLI